MFYVHLVNYCGGAETSKAYKTRTLKQGVMGSEGDCEEPEDDNQRTLSGERLLKYYSD